MEIIFSIIKIALFILMIGGGLFFLAGIGISAVGLYNGIVKKNWDLLRKGVGFLGKGFVGLLIAIILHTIFTLTFKNIY